jgi:hypothetical protein
MPKIIFTSANNNINKIKNCITQERESNSQLLNKTSYVTITLIAPALKKEVMGLEPI